MQFLRTLAAPLVLLAMALTIALPALAEIRQAKIEVSGMTCASCPFTVANSFKEVPSVKIVGGNYDESAGKAVYILHYDDQKTTLEDVLAAPEFFGYKSRLLEGGQG